MKIGLSPVALIAVTVLSLVGGGARRAVSQ
jgi:hypothetical protein